MGQLLQIILLAELFIHGLAIDTNSTKKSGRDGKNFNLEILLENIYKERRFETLLVVADQESLENIILEDTCNLIQVPQVLVTTEASYEFVRTFNAEILAVFLISNKVDMELMASAANLLNYMRQSRILVLVYGEVDQKFLGNFLKLCDLYKMTNVLVKGLNSEEVDIIQQLKPFPHYQWSVWSGAPYYPEHWHNMENKSVVYFTDTTMTLSFPYEDGKGGVKLNGYIARLVLLFGEVFKAHMQMYASHEVAARTSLTQVNQMVQDNLIDIPITLSHYNDGKWLYKSAVYDSLEGLLMIPCALKLSITEVYGVLLNRYFFGCVILCTILFSLSQFVVDYFFDDHHPQQLDSLFNYRFFSGILGQSFSPRKSKWRSLKLIYILIFVAGLNISTQFAATMNTLITSPPNHPQIQSFEDLKNSHLKILAITSDIEAIEDAADIIQDCLLLTDSVSYYEENRNNFNTSMGYFLVSLSWKVLKRKQQYFTQNIFQVYEKMTLFSMPCALQLQKHSIYKEPLDYLINRVHAVGLPQYWYASTFADMLRTKRVTISTPNLGNQARALEVKDLFWPWIILVGGLTSGSLIFLTEQLLQRVIQKAVNVKF
ncbi:uncharacterized protein [Musca autumnalis]|uniref:uncharacterized protein n=1 Tax=Musca autumnalis TaxID=221902 RepID=UPI003CE7E3F5